MIDLLLSQRFCADFLPDGSSQFRRFSTSIHEAVRNEEKRGRRTAPVMIVKGGSCFFDGILAERASTFGLAF
jgi:hypothetical protein